MLQREARVQRGLRDRVTARIPDTRVIDDLEGCPPFAVHTTIPGRPLTTDNYERASPEARGVLVADLARFFCETHSVPLSLACEWLGIAFDGERTVSELVATRGKPVWFSPGAVAEMRPKLMPLLDEGERHLFEDTVGRFVALDTAPGDMVFGHGDIHGYNVAIADDGGGPRLVGAFDLGCTGILDVHEDFFRLSLVSEPMLERVLEVYQGLLPAAGSLDRERIAVYYRAFLFCLMVGKVGEQLGHLKALLHRHAVPHVPSVTGPHTAGLTI
jgi:hypothetical protein